MERKETVRNRQATAAFARENENLIAFPVAVEHYPAVIEAERNAPTPPQLFAVTGNTDHIEGLDRRESRCPTIAPVEEISLEISAKGVLDANSNS
jgi:hypothetical protein